MSAPVMRDDIVQAAATWLLGFPDVVSALGTFVIDGVPTPGLFQYSNWVNIGGSSSTSCVIDSEGGWAAANPHNTLRFPRLSINVWADPIRDSINNNADSGEARRRATQTFWTIDRHLHRAQGGSQIWGDLRTVDCVRLTEPTLYIVPDGDGLVRLMAYYGVTQG